MLKSKGDSRMFKSNFTKVQALLIKQAIEMHRKYGMQMTRGFTVSMAMKAATEYTGKKYKRNEYEQAEKDLQIWMDEKSKFAPTF